MSYKNRRIEEHIFHYIGLGITLFASLILIVIVGFIFIHALPSLTLSYITTPERPGTGAPVGAIGNAVVGTIILSVLSTLLASPFGIGTAIYLSRYARDTALTRSFRFLIETLSGTPSVVIGIFGLLVLAIYFKNITGGYSLIAGTIALAILIIPVIERATEDAIHRVDAELEEGSYSLGATKWQTIWNITVPCATAGMITGVILALGRAAEESAVVFMTAGYNQYMPVFGIHQNENLIFGIQIFPFQHLVGTLPIAIYNAWEAPSAVTEGDIYGAAFVLIGIVLVINLSARGVLWFSENRTAVSKSVMNNPSVGKIITWMITDPSKQVPASDVDSTHSFVNVPLQSDWRLALIQPMQPAIQASVTRNVPQPSLSEKVLRSPFKETKPDLGRNEENQPSQLPWWKQILRRDNDTSAVGTDKSVDSSSLHTTSGDQGTGLLNRLLKGRNTSSDNEIKSKLQSDTELASLIRKERELDELFEGDSNKDLLDRLSERSNTNSGTRFEDKWHSDNELASLIRKERDLDKLLEDNRETQSYNDIRTILYTENVHSAPVTMEGCELDTMGFSRSGEEMNPYTFTRYSCSTEHFGMFEERPLDLPESNYSVQDHDRWRLMHRNREENTFLN